MEGQSKSLLVVYGILLLLLAATAVIHRFELGVWNLLLNLTIAGLKAMLIALFFMRLRSTTPLIRLFSVVGLVWLAILFTFTLADYQDRQHPDRFYDEQGVGGDSR